MAFSPDSFSVTARNTTSRLGSFLEEYGEVTTVLPVLIGLLVTNRLRLRGAQALLVNLTIAAFTRQAVSHLKKQAHASAPIASEPLSENGHSQPTPPSSTEDYMIVHAVPGRMRLRIPRLMIDAAYAKRLEKLLQAEDIVLRVRMNRSASSLILQYDGAGLSELELGMRLLNILEQAEHLTVETAN
jgi:hypothetical protein